MQDAVFTESQDGLGLKGSQTHLIHPCPGHLLPAQAAPDVYFRPDLNLCDNI